MKKSVVLSMAIAIAIAMTACLFSNTWAQANTPGPAKTFGLRLGYGTGPDQFVIGAQSVLGRALGFTRFAPSVDFGFGDGMTTVLLNGDLRVLSFSPPGSPAGLYAGGGPAIAVLTGNNGGSDTEIGLNFLAGLTFPMGTSNLYNLECRFGLSDMPDLRILFGIMLGGNKPKPAGRVIEIQR